MYSELYLIELQLMVELSMTSMVLIGIGILLFIVALLLFIRIKNTTTVKTELTVSTKFPFNVEDLISKLGGVANIKEAIGSYSKIKFMLNDTSVLQLEELKKFSTGIIEQSTGVTLIFGNISKPLAEDINSKIN